MFCILSKKAYYMERRQIFFFLHFRTQLFFGLHGHQLLPAEEAWLRQQVYWLHLFLGESLGFQPNLGGACWEARSFWHGSKSQWHMCIIINVILFECVGQQTSDKKRISVSSPCNMLSWREYKTWLLEFQTGLSIFIAASQIGPWPGNKPGWKTEW